MAKVLVVENAHKEVLRECIKAEQEVRDGKTYSGTSVYGRMTWAAERVRLDKLQKDAAK